MYSIITLSVFFVCFLSISKANANFPSYPFDNDSIQNLWVDSVLSSLTLDEKIAQLIMIRTYSNKNRGYYKQIDKLIKKYNIGGLCFFQGGPVRQAKLTNRYQQIAKTPLLIAIDAEWGLGMRLDSTFSFPYQMTLGAIEDDTLIYKMGAGIARQLKLLGVHINFAPVIDINNNPANPVINSRSFGEDKKNVTKKGIAYMKGLQDNGIIATAKHFPGHGDTDSDSHYTLPIINYPQERLDTLELFPFKELINNGIDAIMVAHLFVPGLDSTHNTPTTLSKPVVTGLLKNKLGFKGLVITDALNMKGVTINHKPGEIELKAFIAGNDILLLPQNAEAAIKSIKEAVKSGVVTEDMINDRCRKILYYKQKAGLNKYSPVKTDSLYQQLNTVNNELISRKIYESAITIVRNHNNIIPLKELDALRLATLSIGSPEINAFQNMLGNYSKVDHFNILKKFTENKANALIKKLTQYNLVIIGIHNTSIFPHKDFGITARTIDLIEKISDTTNVILALFASPYSLKLIKHPEKFETILVSHQDNEISNELTAQIIMGSIGAEGTLPVTATDNFHIGTGINTKSINRLKYTIPEEVGIASENLKKIDSIALFSIKEKATPGCQILIAKDGKVIYSKSFGYHTYKKGNFVKNEDLYDIASVTKVAATTLSVMKLSDEGSLDIDRQMMKYLPCLKNTDKGNIIIREMMAHQARLQPWIPFYLNTIKDGKTDTSLYRSSIEENYTVKVANKLYIRKDYEFIIYDSIISSKLRKRKEYKYSDLGFYLLKKSIENITNQPFDNYVTANFYKPLGLQTICFNPREHFRLSSIIPTENDKEFRKQLIHGYVHDPGAAMLGGVSGHAGLFSNANDLAVMMQMLLQNGEYGGKRYINSNTVAEFTKRQFPLNDNRRGIGFDKPNTDDLENGPTCESASGHSYGHSGFTGTYAWIDPEYNLVYIFLSNRIHPASSNTKLLKMNTRTEIQQVIYDAILKSENKKAPGDEIGASDSIQ